jgi:hypothetical protein
VTGLWKKCVHLYIGPKGVRFVPIFEKSGNFWFEIDENAKNLKKIREFGEGNYFRLWFV